MAEIIVVPATVDLWDDIQTVLNGGGDGKNCQCTWPLLRGPEWRASSAEQRRNILHANVENSNPAPGLLAYINDTPVGWVRVGPRAQQIQLGLSRVVKTGSPEPFTATDVWAVTCFSVRTGYRKQGVSAALLHAAVGYAQSSNARIIEAYPVDNTNTNTKTSASSLFVGALTTFLSEGFTVVGHPTQTRAVVALSLKP